MKNISLPGNFSLFPEKLYLEETRNGDCVTEVVAFLRNLAWIIDLITTWRQHLQGFKRNFDRATLNRGFGVGSRWIGHTNSIMLTGLLAFPAYTLHHGPVDLNGILVFHGTFHDTTGAVPAFFRVEYDRYLFLLRIGHHYIVGTSLNAKVTADTDLDIDQYRLIGGDSVREGIYF